MFSPPIKVTSLPTTDTLVKGVDHVGKSKNVFQSDTEVASPTKALAPLMLVKPKVKLPV
jgi:hypothetical protein